MTKQIKIEELIPLIKISGYVAMDKDGDWYWFSDTPEMEDKMGYWFDCLGRYKNLSEMFNIAPAEDWTKSLMKVGDK